MAAATADLHPDAERILVPIADGAMAGWRWPSPGARQLVFLHATGFCARAYAAMFETARKGLDIVALDLRGHGRTQLRADPPALKSWNLYADDLRAALDALPAPAGGRVLAGHSCGAVVAALAAVSRSDIAGLALIEPVATPGWMSFLARGPLWTSVVDRWPLVRGARMRRPVFASRNAAATSYAKKPLFARWRAGVLEAYLEDGLLETEDGVRLACTPAWEAATFAAQAHDFWGAIRRANAPIRVLVARDASSTVNPRAARALQRLGVGVTAESGATHLLPFENPQQAGAFLLNATAVDTETR